MKLYTRSGDDGMTGLFGAQRVGKDDPRVEAYGTVDELNSSIGLAIAALDAEIDADGRFRGLLTAIQSRLFDLGADLATPTDSKHADRIARMTEGHVRDVEALIDDVDRENEPLQRFVLPGGTELAARLHQARGVCRRAERRVVNLGRSAKVNAHALVYLNRLGDLLFALARAANRRAGVPDVEWTGGEPG